MLVSAIETLGGWTNIIVSQGYFHMSVAFSLFVVFFEFLNVVLVSQYF